MDGKLALAIFLFMTLKMPDGFAIAQFDELNSTNDKAREFAKLGETGPLVIFTKNQTGGRGRDGRVWQSTNQILTTSFLISSFAPKENLAQLAFVMAVAAHDAITSVVADEHHAKIGLKWPNDILVSGRKIAGILIESFINPNDPNSTLAIGIGVNVGASPDHDEILATSLAALGSDISVEAFLEILALKFKKYFDIWSDGKNFSEIRSIWLKSALGLGGKITARLPNQTHYGIFDQLDKDGILILRNENNQLIKITAGDVFIGHI